MFKRLTPALAMILVVAGLILTLYGVSQARSRNGIGAPSDARASSSTATATPTVEASQPPVSGPTPTPVAGGHPVTPSNGSDPFIVQAVTIEDDCSHSIGVCDAHEVCSSNPVIYINGFAWLPKNAPDGYITYRWRLSDGTVTAPAVAHYSWDDKYRQNLIVYHYTVDPAIADGRPFWVQLEILKPNAMISLRSPNYTIVCLPIVMGAAITPVGTARIYDCAAGGTQTFDYEATEALYPSPSYSFSYYWQRSDGSVSPTYTATTTAGATSVALHGDAITITPSTPYGDYNDTLVIPNPPGQPPMYQASGTPVAYLPCSSSTPTPTATPAPTATT